MSAERTPIAVKKSPRSHHVFVTYVTHLADCLSGNASFPNPTPSVAMLQSKAASFAQANARAKGGGPGAVADRNAARLDLEGDLDDLVFYVRKTVRAMAGDPAATLAMILSTGLSVRKSGKARKPPLAARHGLVSGEVVLAALAVAKTAMYFWVYSVDQVTWVSVTATLQASTTIAGLMPGQVYYFRFSAQTRRGLGEASDVVRLRVL